MECELKREFMQFGRCFMVCECGVEQGYGDDDGGKSEAARASEGSNSVACSSGDDDGVMLEAAARVQRLELRGEQGGDDAGWRPEAAARAQRAQTARRTSE